MCDEQSALTFKCEDMELHTAEIHESKCMQKKLSSTLLPHRVRLFDTPASNCLYALLPLPTALLFSLPNAKPPSHHVLPHIHHEPDTTKKCQCF